ncbi:tripartite tricarboxylate transporter TctB family protein [Saliphagus sp. GCM10025334]
MDLQNRNLDKRELERYASLFAVVVFLGLFAYLHSLAVDYPRRGGQFPVLVLRAGIFFCIAYLVYQTIVLQLYPSLKRDENGGMGEYLKGSKSQFDVAIRFKRGIILLTGIIAFYAIGTVNLVLAVFVCYTAIMLALGKRDPKLVIGSAGGLSIFVYLVFVIILDVPLEVF